MEYQLVNPVPLGFMRISQGAPVTGLSVSVVVKNTISGTTLLTSTALSEITNGVYSYNWTHGLTVQTECVALYTVLGKVYAENFTISTITDIDEHLEGRAI